MEVWADYGGRAETPREHSGELQTVFGFEPFTTGHHRLVVRELVETAMRTDKGIVLAATLVSSPGKQATFTALGQVELMSQVGILSVSSSALSGTAYLWVFSRLQTQLA